MNPSCLLITKKDNKKKISRPESQRERSQSENRKTKMTSIEQQTQWNGTDSIDQPQQEVTNLEINDGQLGSALIPTAEKSVLDLIVEN